jgi:HK97 family phage portal protein
MPSFVQRVKDAFSYIWNAENMVYTPLFATGPGLYWPGSFIDWSFAWQNAYNDNEIVYEALRVYLRKAKIAPIILSKITNEKALNKYESFVTSAKNQEHRLTAMIERKKALEELDKHSIIDLFNKPNTYQTRSELFESWFGYWKLSGNGYLYGGGSVDIGVNAGKFRELHVLESQNVTVIYSRDWRNPILRYDYNIDGEIVQIPPQYICHLKDWNPKDKKVGLSPTIPGARVIKTDSYNATAQARAFENGGKGYMLSSDSDNEDFQWTKEQADMVDEKIRQKLQGAHNNGNIFSVTRPVKVQPIGDSVADMKLLEAKKYNRPVIGNLFGVDGILIGDKENSSYNNGQEAQKGLVTNTIMPDLLEAAEHLRKWLLPAYGGGLYLDFDTTVYPELQPDLTLMSTVFGKPSLTEDERRAIFNYDKLDDTELGSAILVASGLETLQSVVKGANTDTTDQMVEDALKQLKY